MEFRRWQVCSLRQHVLASAEVHWTNLGTLRLMRSRTNKGLFAKEDWPARFWNQVDTTGAHRESPQLWDGCWNWLGSIKPDGYAQIRVHGIKKYAHRVAYELAGLVIPKGMQLDHLCRNRKCVNPLHLEPVSNRTNALRGISPFAENARKTHCPSGHPYDEANTKWYQGRRYCKACR